MADLATQKAMQNPEFRAITAGRRGEEGGSDRNLLTCGNNTPGLCEHVKGVRVGTPLGT